MRSIIAAVVLSATLLAAHSGQSQHYRPFGVGRTYHFREAGTPDLLYTFRVDSVFLNGGDSVFCFNRTNGYFSLNGSPGYGTPAKRRNRFGGFQHWSAATGEAVFTAADSSATVRVLTRGPVGQTWTFAPNVQATLLSRQATVVLGQPDTVLTIALSDGAVIAVARRYGLIAGPSFDFYLGNSYDGALTRHPLTLAGIPELALGAVDLTWRSIWDIQPGDEYYYRASNTADIGSGGGNSARSRYRLRVLSRQLNAAGDSLIFRADREAINDVYSSIYWSGTRTTTYEHWPSVRFSQPVAGPIPMLTAVPTSSPGPGPFYFPLGAWPAVQHPDTLGGHPVFGNRFFFEGGTTVRFAAGLGQVYDFQHIIVDPTIPNSGHFSGWKLVGYAKAGDSWGDTAAIILGTPAEKSVFYTTLAPNPTAAAAWLTVRVEQPQTATLALYDGLGRAVWRQEKALAADEQQLPIGPRELAPGLYRLRLTLADGRQRILPLVRQ